MTHTVPEELVAEYAKRQGARIDDMRDYIRLHLAEDAQRLAASEGISLADALEAIAAIREADEHDMPGRVTAEARRSVRSLNGEIIFRLRESLDQQSEAAMTGGE
jgi:hypothetical protein